MTHLNFRTDGSFTIVQFTDLHLQNGEPKDLQTYALMEEIIQAEAPDLIILTGDVIYSKKCTDPLESFQMVIQVFDKYNIPWATVFGNHDAENNCTKEELMALLQGSLHSLTKVGSSLENRWGNDVLTIASSKSNRPSAALYLLDSGGSLQHPLGGYEWVNHRQIGWYKDQSMQLTQHNNGVPLPSLAFFHIPLPEYNEVWNYHVCYGHNYEGMGCPKVNSGLFTAFIEGNDVKGIFVGHDHINDFWGELHGIRLCYGRATGYNTYGKEGFQRGARIIRLLEGESGFQSWLRLDDGSIITAQPEHQPEHVWKRI